jgi:hypothetical protein
MLQSINSNCTKPKRESRPNPGVALLNNNIFFSAKLNGVNEVITRHYWSHNNSSQKQHLQN